MLITPYNDEYFMRQAFMEAQKAFELGEIPVGAVVVVNNQIIARAHNLTERLHDVTAHAEMQAITAASEYLGAKYLKDCTLYVTLEPCVMCAGASFWSQLGEIHYGASDPNRGFARLTETIIHPKTKVKAGLMATEAKQLLDDFFKKLRN